MILRVFVPLADYIVQRWPSGPLIEYSAWLESHLASVAVDQAEAVGHYTDEEELIEDPISLTEEELFVGLTAVLVGTVSSFVPSSKNVLDIQVHLYTFKWD